MIPAWFADILSKHPRVAVTGGPKTGKTTLCAGVTDRPVLHTDDFKHLEWSEASQAVVLASNDTRGSLVIEGVAVPRALRKGMQVDAVVMLDGAHEPLSKGQAAMAAGVWTVLQKWREANPDVLVYFRNRHTTPDRDAHA